MANPVLSIVENELTYSLSYDHLANQLIISCEDLSKTYKWGTKISERENDLTEQEFSCLSISPKCYFDIFTDYKNNKLHKDIKITFHPHLESIKSPNHSIFIHITFTNVYTQLFHRIKIELHPVEMKVQ